MAETKRYLTVLDDRDPFIAILGDSGEWVFRRALTANLELALDERRERTPDEARDVIASCINHMSERDDADTLFDLLPTVTIVQIIRDAALHLRAVPTTGGEDSSTPRSQNGDTGNDGQD